MHCLAMGQEERVAQRPKTSLKQSQSLLLYILSHTGMKSEDNNNKKGNVSLKNILSLY